MRKMQYLLLVILSFAAIVSFCEDKVAVRPENGNLLLLLQDYAEKSGKSIEVVQGVDAHIKLVSEKTLTLPEYLETIESKLKEHNIGLFPIPTNRLVATWIDPSKIKNKKTKSLSPQSTSNSKPLSYVERLRLRREQQEKEKLSNK